MNRLLSVFIAIALLSGCAGEQGKYVRWVERHLTYEDKASYKPEFWEQNVAKALEVRDRMGWDVPEDIFRHFVLPVQVVDRGMDNFRMVYADSLCQRVQGMNMWDAAREINYWCLERAIYGHDSYSKDTPRGTLERGEGACDELTNLYVSALRAAGIPARAGSATWPHAASSHKWAEIWIDGQWHFEGAAEPCEDLDASWMCNGLPKAMMFPVKIFGRYKGPEPVLSKDRHWTVIDNGARYEPRRVTTVTVVDAGGRRVKGATVEFKIFNSGKLVTLYSAKSDRKGQVSLEMGTGAMVVWGCKDGMYGFAKAEREKCTLAINHPVSGGGTSEFTIETPPRVSLPYPKTDEMVARMDTRNHHSDTLRMERHALPPRDSLIKEYRAEARRPFISGGRLVTLGPTKIEIVSDDEITFGDNFGLHQILEDGSTKEIKAPSVSAGSYLAFTEERLIAKSPHIKATVINVPDGATSLSLPLSIPTVPDAELKCLYKMPSTDGVDLGDRPWRIMGLVPDDSSVMSAWIQEIGLDDCRIYKPTDKDNPEYAQSLAAVQDVAAKLGLGDTCLMMTDPEGNVWYAADHWDKDVEWALTATRSALEKR